MTLPLSNADFLAAKIKVAEVTGFSVDLDAISPVLKPHCRAISPWPPDVLLEIANG